MSRDKVQARDMVSFQTENGHVEDAMYPCPKCGKGGSKWDGDPCPTCGAVEANHVPSKSLKIRCGVCGHTYERDSVPVMTFTCRKCGKPGFSDRYIDDMKSRIHKECPVAPVIH